MSATFYLTSLPPFENVCDDFFLQISMVAKKVCKLYFSGQKNTINFAKTLVATKDETSWIHTQKEYIDSVTKPTKHTTGSLRPS